MQQPILSAIKAVLFDVDDTLFDREAAQSIVLRHIVTQFPDIFRNLEIEKISASFIESDRVVMRDFDTGAPSEGLRDARSRVFLRLLNISEEHAESITLLYVRDYPNVNASVPGSVRLLGKLRQKFKVGIVSNGLPDVQYRKLETLGIRNMFELIILSEEIGIRKPDPGIFQIAASRLGLRPQECLYVGDSYANDVVGARRAGMSTCWIDRKNTASENRDSPADITINRMEELAGLLSI